MEKQAELEKHPNLKDGSVFACAKKEVFDMAEEVKQEAKEADAKKTFSTILKVILGLAFLVVGAYLVYRGWYYLIALIKGCVGLFFIMAGLITLAIAKD
ncbi:MAG: hypothetical protein ACM3IL_02575 [Deltaproteobacteria bacterium]